MNASQGVRPAFTPDYRNPAKGYHFEEEVLEALDAISASEGRESVGRKYLPMKYRDPANGHVRCTVVGFVSKTASTMADVRLSSVVWHGDHGSGYERCGDDIEGATRLSTLLLQEDDHRHLYLVPHGEEPFFRHVLSCWAMHWVNDGYSVSPESRNGIISGFTIRKGKSTWKFMDYTRHTGILPQESDEYVALHSGMFRDHSGCVRALYEIACTFHELDRKWFGIRSSDTAASTGIAVHRAFFDKTQHMWSPPDNHVAFCRFGGGNIGGYLHFEKYDGVGFEVDQRKAYSKPMADRIPKTWMQGTPWVEGVMQEGMYLSWITKRGGHPIRLKTWRRKERRFVSEVLHSGERLAVINTVEHPGLEALGCVIEPIYGWRVTSWFTMRGMIDRAFEVYASEKENPLYCKRVKLLVNSVPGKFTSDPNREQMLIAKDRPGEGWYPAVDRDGYEIENNWVSNTHVATSYQNVAASAWIYAAQRSDTYLFIAEQAAVGNRCVHWAVDGGLFAGEPQTDIPVDTEVPGTFRLLRSNAHIVVHNYNQTIVNGKITNAGTKKDIPPAQILMIEHDALISSVHEHIRRVLVVAQKDGAVPVPTPWAIPVYSTGTTE